jgi:8-oxo-dGTP pyrophosphatase MutT (NUDIX family)
VPLADRSPDPTIATYDRIAGQFAALHWDYSALHPALEIFAARIVGVAPTDRYRILDAGCGPGQAAAWFQARGFQTYGIDLSEGMLAEARRRVPGATFRLADLRALDFPDGFFDGIWCSAALLHLARPDVPGVLASFNRLLGHGYLWLAVKAGEGEEVTEAPYGPGNGRRFTYFEPAEIELAVERAGFDIHDVSSNRTAKSQRHPWISIMAQTKLKTPLIAAIAVVFDGQGRVLLSERADGFGWNLPAGFIDPSESPEEAVVREAREETGLDVAVDRFIGYGTSKRFPRPFGPTIDGNLVTFAYLCHAVGGSLEPTNEAIRHGWFDPAALPSPMSSRRHIDILTAATKVVRGQAEPPIIWRHGEIVGRSGKRP